MPDFMQTPFDQLVKRSHPEPLDRPERPVGEATLPTSGWAAVARGLRGRCPRCGEARLFNRFLKPILICPNCAQDLTHQQADDFPAYVSILVTGHLMAPIIIALVRDADLSAPAMMTIILPVALVLMIGLLQPAKGAIIALQWWLGMHGFEKERPSRPQDEAGS